MSLEVYAENNDGNLVILGNRLRSDSFEVTVNAIEATVGESTVVLDDPAGDFYIRGHKKMYFVETEAATDAYKGIIGPFYTWNRRIRRGESSRTSNSREWHVSLKDINTLLSRRVQKGNDANRHAETDVARMQWLVNTAEVVGGVGDDGLNINDQSFLFTDTPVQMDATNYTGQDSAGVINDALQDSGKNSYLFNSPSAGSNLRIGIWYGVTERSDFASVHRISNVKSDVNIDPAEASFTMSAAALIAGTWTFAPSMDTELDRDPSRVYHGAMVQYDGNYAYDTDTDTSALFAPRDGVFAAELVKTHAQALRRAAAYLDRLNDEDDAIETAVVVPSALIHAFMPGHRVQVRFSSLPGYEADFVWMRVARVTYRQLSADSLLYELGLDLRTETPPTPAVPAPGTPVACPDDTPGLEEQYFWPLGAHVPPNGDAGDTPEPGVIQYARAGIAFINEPSTTHRNSWHFPVYGIGGEGSRDYCGANLGNSMRFVTTSAGVITVDAFGSFNTSFDWKLIHWTGSIEVTEQSGSIGINGSMIPVTVPADSHCYHTLILYNFTAVGPGRFNFDGAHWEPELT